MLSCPFACPLNVRQYIPYSRFPMSDPQRALSTAQTSPRGAIYTISDLAREFALTTRAIRFYEDAGLVAPARHGQSRVYGERERVRIKLILRGKRLGLTLSEIRELFDLYEIAHNERAQLAKFVDMLEARRARLLQQREDIDVVLVEIAGLEGVCRRRLQEEAERAGTPAAAATKDD